MNKSRYHIIWIFSGLASLVFSCGQPEKISFNEEIRPIINSKCITCHGGVKEAGGLSFLFREDALGPTDSGIPAIIPGDPINSEILKRIKSHDPELRMPFEADPLSEKEIDLIEQWIDEGANWEEHWAFIPPDRNIIPPEVDKPVNTDIDRFLLKKLKENGLSFTDPAENHTLLRRVYLDLIGLPPTPEEAQEYLSDPDDHAYEKLVDRLLASPHFGEKWASMWLDLARYADTKGYEKDLNRSIWKYRDWVIKAFNDDMPFDQFTIEQLAGDLLPNPSQSQLIATAFHRNSMANDEGGTDNEEFRVASVIERVGTTSEVWQGTTMACVQCHSHPYDPIRHEEFYQFMAFFNNQEDRDIYNEQPKLFTYEPEEKEKLSEILSWVEDKVADKNPEVISEAKFLHQKKEELLYSLGYRKIQAEEFHNSSKLIELLSPDQDVIWQIQDSSWIMFEDVDLTDIESIDFYCATAISGGFIDIRLDNVNGSLIGQTEVTKTGQWDRWAGTKPEKEKWKSFKASITPTNGLHDIYYVFRINKDLNQHLFHLDWIYYHEKNPKKNQYGQAFNQKLSEMSSMPFITTPIMRDLPPEKSRVTHVFERGNWLTPGKEVTADIPQVFGGLPKDAPHNRLGLAEWIASTDNPLTARVAVNRFWEKIFGYGIIETAEEFGSLGTPPSHPELLDWLAVQFMEEYQWSTKRLLKEIVLSKAYRQKSISTDEKNEIDPYNRLISRGPRVRLSIEQLRDQVLSVSDLLNPGLYGPSVNPPRPDVANDGWSSWNTDLDSDQYRRSLYIFGKRTNPYPMLTLFDATPRNVCTSRRIRTNTPLQALTSLNDATFYEAAKRLGTFMNNVNQENIRACISAGYKRVMFREIDESRLAALETLYEDTRQNYLSDQLVHPVSSIENDKVRVKSLTVVANALLNLDEFLTKN
ncbi:MAG: DUF1553 domain-containing protein [Bacteroidota bacterium]